MKKIGNITFHSAQNFGSALQEYALQEFVKEICNKNCDYKIINMQKKEQKEMYKIYDYATLKNIIKRMIFLNYKKDIRQKEKLFDDFITDKLNITKEYSSLNELKEENLEFDYIISGSDQVWNLHARDFDWANLIEFSKNAKKVSYAASFGPEKQNWTEEQQDRMRKDLLEFEYLSVREEGSFNNVKKLIDRDVSINIDPTMLLNKSKWLKNINEEPIIKKKYILLYDIYGNKDAVEIAKEISKIFNFPVVILRNEHKLHMIHEFEKHYATGPCEFLNILNNAELVLSSSFHGTVFSILLQKPFFAINGLKDFRINTLLNRMNLEDRSVNVEDFKNKCEKAFDIDFKESEIILDKERKRSEEYLKKALDLV